MNDQEQNSTKTKVIAIFVLLFLVAIGMGLIYSRNLSNQALNKKSESSKISETKTDSKTEIPSQEPTVSFGSTDVIFKSADQILKTGLPTKVGVSLAGTGVVSADFVFKYDPMMLEFVNAEKGGYFDFILKNTSDKTKGEIRFSATISADKSTSGLSGEAVVLNFTPLKSGKSNVSLDPDQTITALKGQNILNKANIKSLEMVVNQ